MIIAVNLLAVNKDIGGAYNYIDNLLTTLNNQPQIHSFKIFHTDNNLDLVNKYNNFSLIHCKLKSKNRFLRVIYENTIFQFLLFKKNVDVVIWPSDTIGFLKIKPTIVIFHDFLPLVSPHSFGFFKRFYLFFALKFAIRNANFSFFISRTTQNELLKIVPNFDLNNSLILPNIIDERFKMLNSSELNEIKFSFVLPEFFFLYVAHFYPHKNHIRLITSFGKYKIRSQVENLDYFKLVLRGDGLEENINIISLINEFNLENDIIFLPRLSSLELIKLYNLASALVFPSLYEGGGIPIMEALACQCPIIASEIEAVKEFTEGMCFNFNPYDCESIADSLYMFSNNYKVKQIVENTHLIINHRGSTVSKNFYKGINVIQKK